MKNISLLAAKCASCGRSFSHPSLGEFAYGEAILCTVDGKCYATASASAGFSQRVGTLIKSAGVNSLWPVLAALADPISGQLLTDAIRCPYCASGNLEYWGGKKTGHIGIPEASFTSAAALSDGSLSQRIASVVEQCREK